MKAESIIFLHNAKFETIKLILIFRQRIYTTNYIIKHITIAKQKMIKEHAASVPWPIQIVTKKKRQGDISMAKTEKK